MKPARFFAIGVAGIAALSGAAIAVIEIGTNRPNTSPGMGAPPASGPLFPPASPPQAALPVAAPVLAPAQAQPSPVVARVFLPGAPRPIPPIAPVIKPRGGPESSEPVDVQSALRRLQPLFAPCVEGHTRSGGNRQTVFSLELESLGNKTRVVQAEVANAGSAGEEVAGCVLDMLRGQLLRSVTGSRPGDRTHVDFPVSLL